MLKRIGKNFADAGRNVGNSFLTGYLGVAGDLGSPLNHLPSRGGTLLGLSTFGGFPLIGAGAGAALASASDDPGANIGIGAAAGAAVGAAVLPAAGAVAGLGYKVASNFDKIGEAAFTTGKTVGAGIGKSLNSTNRFLNPVSTFGKATARAFSKISKSMVSDTPNGGMRLSKLGWGAVLGTFAANAVFGAKNTYEENNMGVSDGIVTAAAPRIPQYNINNASATGDLVFALNANRRG